MKNGKELIMSVKVASGNDLKKTKVFLNASGQPTTPPQKFAKANPATIGNNKGAGSTEEKEGGEKIKE